jgi:chromosome segregation protein
VRDQALRTGLVEQVEAAQAVLDAAEAAWRAAWAPAGVQPLDPAAMRDWVARRSAVLALVKKADEARRRREQEQARHGRIVDRLAALLPDAAPDGGVGPLQREAVRRLAVLDAAAKAYGQAQADAGSAQLALQKATDRLAEIDAKLEAWGVRWRDAAPALGLTAASTVEDGATALALWTDIQAHEAAWRDAADRIAQMDSALAAHDGAAAGLAARLGAPVADADAPALRARLDAARAAQTEKERLKAEAQVLAAAIAAHRQAEAQTEAGLDALRRLAGAADDDALLAAIGRAAAHAALAATVRDREAELHRLDDGKTAAELDEEAAEMDIDAIPIRLNEIETRLRELDAERVELGGRLAECKADLQQKEEGQDVAGPAQAMQDSLAEIQQDADRYVRLRLAHGLLRGGIDGFRRSQQGPLLTRAGGYFETLTDGRYHRLDLDEGQKGEPVIVAARRDGSHCPAEELSEGTRDQLFLALRLASIGLEAQGMEPLPLIADDLLVNFDDRRALAALRLLAEFGRTTQVILFTHHDHIAGMIDPATASLHRMPAGDHATAPASRPGM